jgi:2-oxoglutarate ferredoxin oxidoreductase subunit delta
LAQFRRYALASNPQHTSVCLRFEAQTRLDIEPKSFFETIYRSYQANCSTKDITMGKEKLKQHIINREWCKGCGICVEFCPKKVLKMDEEEKAVAARPQDCICCRLCELRCPDLAIEIETEIIES